MPAWPFNTSDTEILKPWAQGIRELLCYEFYRKSALRFINTPGAITLPGSVCEKDVWRLQPHLIPSLSKRLQDIAEYGSRVMRGGRSTVQPKQLEKAS
jgi:hypothetical protein